MRTIKGITRSVHTAVWLVHLVFSTVFLYLRQTALRRLERKEGVTRSEIRVVARKAAATWASSQLRWAGVKIDARGLENIPDGSVVFVGNHQSYLDVGVLLTVVKKPIGFVAKKELKKIPIVPKFMERYLDCVFIDRDDLKQAAKTITEATRLVKEGHSMVIYPEGTRSREGNKMGVWKAGSFKLATRSGAAIVPVTTINAFAALEGNNYRVKPGTITVIFSPPIETAGLERDDVTSLPERVKAIVQSNIDEFCK